MAPAFLIPHLCQSPKILGFQSALHSINHRHNCYKEVFGLSLKKEKPPLLWNLVTVNHNRLQTFNINYKHS